MDELFDRLFKIFSSKRFLLKEALGGEIPFFVQSFPPQQQSLIDKHLPYLIKRLAQIDIVVLEINLYELCLSILTEQEVLENALQEEPEMNKTEYLEALIGPLNIQDEVVPKIKKEMLNAGAKLVFLTGIGAIYPIIRSHTILNNLHALIKDIPLIMFFPGIYDNHTLTLFGRLKDDNYYRAFHLNDYTI